MSLFLAFDDLKLNEFLALKKDGHFTVRGNVLTIHRTGEPEKVFVCRSPGEANQVRLLLADGLAGHIEGGA